VYDLSKLLKPNYKVRWTNPALWVAVWLLSILEGSVNLCPCPLAGPADSVWPGRRCCRCGRSRNRCGPAAPTFSGAFASGRLHSQEERPWNAPGIRIRHECARATSKRAQPNRGRAKSPCAKLGWCVRVRTSAGTPDVRTYAAAVIIESPAVVRRATPVASLVLPKRR
jgi:hypothetical protein